MKAKEMFEELGYRESDSSRYIKQSTMDTDITINFGEHNTHKAVKRSETWNWDKRQDTKLKITEKERLAIQKKKEELGWLK